MTLGPDFPPIDEGANDVQFSEFRRNLVNSIDKKSYDWAIARIGNDIKYNYDEGNAKKELLKLWELMPQTKELFFSELRECLVLGGQFMKFDDVTYFVAPYVHSAWPDDFDPSEHLAVTSVTASIYEKADDTLEPLEVARHTIVKQDLSSRAEGWHLVEYADGKWGWIKDADVRSPIDYRAFFERDYRGSYVLKTFLAGD